VKAKQQWAQFLCSSISSGWQLLHYSHFQVESKCYSSKEAESNKLEYQAARKDVLPEQSFLPVILCAYERGSSSRMSKARTSKQTNIRVTHVAETPNVLASVEYIQKSIPKST
jgi:hypothetical protein